MFGRCVKDIVVSLTTEVDLCCHMIKYQTSVLMLLTGTALIAFQFAVDCLHQIPSTPCTLDISAFAVVSLLNLNFKKWNYNLHIYSTYFKYYKHEAKTNLF